MTEADLLLLARAEAYGRDTAAIRAEGNPTGSAVIYETIRDELRRCAEEARGQLALAWAEGYAARGLEAMVQPRRRSLNPYDPARLGVER